MRFIRSAAKAFLEPIRKAKPLDLQSALNAKRVESILVDGQTVNWVITNAADEIQQTQKKAGFYELQELRQLRLDCGPRRSVLDIGANIGNHAVFFSMFMGCEELTCVEPSPSSYAHLLVNLSINATSLTKFTGLKLALGSESGRGSLISPSRFNAGMSRIEINDDATIPILTADQVVGGGAVDLIKIDVEGMEDRVLAGMSEILKKQRPAVYVETDLKRREEIIQQLTGCGYRLHRHSVAYGNQSNLTLLPK